MASERSAFSKTPKNFHSARAFRRSNILLHHDRITLEAQLRLRIMLLSFRHSLQPLNSELIAPSLEALTWHAVKFQILERAFERNCINQRCELAVEEGVVAMLD